MKRSLPFLIVALVALLTIGGATWLYRSKRPAGAVRVDASAQKTDTAGAHILGNPEAPVTVEEFGDFQCPPCGLLAEPINKVERDFRPRVRVIFHEFPLPMHEHAREAALAAEAAGLQGRFWEMHDLLYREQATWTKAPDVQNLFRSYAGMLGLNVERFKSDMFSNECAQRIAADEKLGKTYHVINTPTILINYWALGPKSLSEQGLRTAVDAALNGKPMPIE